MYKSYYIPNFPVNKITVDGRDGWINVPNHPKNKYKFLDAILEHIDNTNHIDPIRIVIHDENQVHVGPSGTSRLYALTHIRNYKYVPAMVSTTKYYDWFGDDIVEIKTKEQIRSYLLLEPVTYELEPDGKIWWHNENPNESQIRKTFKVSNDTIERILKCI
jgi:hypothetical protein